MATVNSHSPSDFKKTDILVVGVDSLIGSRLASALTESGYLVVGTTRRPSSPAIGRIQLDLTSPSDFGLLPRCRAAVLCAAVTSMESCRREPKATRLINVTSTLRLARHLLKDGSHVVFLSSNAVFDGHRPHARPTDPTCPRTEYGRQKAEAESQLLPLNGPISIVRFSKIVAPEVPLLRSWVSDLRTGRNIYPFSDARLSPVPLRFAVELLRRVLDVRATGIIQVSATSDISYEQFARHLAWRLGYKQQLIEPISCVHSAIEHMPLNTTLEATELATLGLQAPQAMDALDELASALLHN